MPKSHMPLLAVPYNGEPHKTYCMYCFKWTNARQNLLNQTVLPDVRFMPPCISPPPPSARARARCRLHAYYSASSSSSAITHAYVSSLRRSFYRSRSRPLNPPIKEPSSAQKSDKIANNTFRQRERTEVHCGRRKIGGRASFAHKMCAGPLPMNHDHESRLLPHQTL